MGNLTGKAALLIATTAMGTGASYLVRCIGST